MAHVSLHAFALLMAAAFAASFVDAIAGGGGLVTLPALALAGLDPLSAVATNKLQSSFGSGSAALAFWRAGKVEPGRSAPLILASGGGSILGALALAHVPVTVIQTALPVVLAGVALYFAFSPALSDEDSHQRAPFALFAASIAPALGFYDGVFGPGTGSFLVLAFVEVLGFGVVRAVAHARVSNFASNLAALAAFALAGRVVWTIGLAMGAAQFIGGRLGAHASLRNGRRLVRPAIVCMCLAMAARLAISAW